LLHRFVLHNEDLREAPDCVLAPGQVGLLSGWGVFSTIKVMDGVPFAFERHWTRMQRDAALMRVPFPPDPEPLRISLLRLLEANRAHRPHCGPEELGPRSQTTLRAPRAPRRLAICRRQDAFLGHEPGLA
jgi:branched-subunit amino acid aminotransferase/4-amino-4-deoxychorismate lyase